MIKKALLPLALWAFASHAMAEEEYYTVRLNNVFIGEFTFSHEFKDEAYTASIAAETIGFAKSIILASFEGEAKGKGTKYRQYIPESANMDVRTPDFQNEYQIRFEGDQMKEASNSLGIKTNFDFSNTLAAVDPVTAFAYIFRPLDFEHLCEMRVEVVDGLHLRRLILGKIERRQDGRLQCKGGIERIGGYTDAELAARPNYKITAVYSRFTETEFILDRMLAETPWGEVEIAHEF